MIGRVGLTVHTYPARGNQESVTVFYSFSKYLSQVQKRLQCSPFLQEVQSDGKPKTGSQCNMKSAVIGDHGIFLGLGWEWGRGAG